MKNAIDSIMAQNAKSIRQICAARIAIEMISKIPMSPPFDKWYHISWGL